MHFEWRLLLAIGMAFIIHTVDIAFITCNWDSVYHVLFEWFLLFAVSTV